MTDEALGTTPGIAVLADDLSGAAEVAGAFLDRDMPVSLQLNNFRPSTGVTVMDLNTRAMTPQQATETFRAAVAGIPADFRVVKKIDSLLRGHIGPEVAVLADRGPVVLAAAMPALTRTVRGGVLYLGETPLHETNAWVAERGLPPRRIADLFAEPPVDLGRLEICDAATDADLDAIVAAAPGAQLVGTSAMAAAVARTLPARGRDTVERQSSKTVLTVAGTAAFVAAGQVDALVADGARHVVVDVHALLHDKADPEPVQEALGNGLAVVTVGGCRRPIPTRPGAHRRRDGQGRHRCHRSYGTAACSRNPPRCSRIGLPRRPPRRHKARKLRHGYQSGDHRPIPHPTKRGQHMTNPSLPIVAVTMGDGAGIGPEVVVPALLDAAVLAICNPVVIGDAKRLRLAAEIVGVTADIVAVDSIADAKQAPGRINVIDLDLLPDDLPWGQLSAVAGNAAYEYIRVASELAVRGEVQAICTAPLNKEALHAADHIYPGHTELLAHLTGTEEVSMMLSTPKLKVIHVTTHIGLLDAVAKIEPGLVERTVRRGHEALVRTGIANPKIGVCGINPHAGEGGLFGYGEEEQKIIPAVEVLKADGIDVHGPLPADTAFFLAGRGDYDLIVAMYHDQGHGPVKVLGIEAGVNITVGLPVIRTSVDHGTAFDIAGKGIAEHGSMIEALRQAADLASSTAVVR
jgi:4-phospho-D-threonate 3-dehydrogenase / 4-phospho-D-erythronate 3-dehydrogenase